MPISVKINENEQEGACPHVVSLHDDTDTSGRREVLWGARTMPEASAVAMIAEIILSEWLEPADVAGVAHHVTEKLAEMARRKARA